MPDAQHEKLFDELLQARPGHTMPIIAVPLAEDPDIIGAIAEAIRLKIASFLLIGDRDRILALAEAAGGSLEGASFRAEHDEGAACQLAADLVAAGDAQILMKGLVQTSSFSRAFLQRDRGLVPKGGLVSHVALFEVPSYHKPLIVTDAALNIAPSLEEKKIILRNAIDFATALGIETPKAACIAAVEKVNPKIKSTTDAQALVEAFRQGEFSPAIVDGPFGLDVAIHRESAETKGVDSPVAGDPDILLLPALDAANVLYKTLTKFMNCRVASSIAGAKAPIILTSRADTEETKLLSIGLAARMAQAQPDG